MGRIEHLRSIFAALWPSVPHCALPLETSSQSTPAASKFHFS